jgi:hypothetical protein
MTLILSLDDYLTIPGVQAAGRIHRNAVWVRVEPDHAESVWAVLRNRTPLNVEHVLVTHDITTPLGWPVALETDEIEALIYAAEESPWMQNPALDTALAKLRGIQTILINQAIRQWSNSNS